MYQFVKIQANTENVTILEGRVLNVKLLSSYFELNILFLRHRSCTYIMTKMKCFFVKCP